MMDPYEMNEVKGTRMPDWSKVDKERDMYGELAWIKNFHVKLSKNNNRMHQKFKEFLTSHEIITWFTIIQHNKTFLEKLLHPSQWLDKERELTPPIHLWDHSRHPLRLEKNLTIVSPKHPEATHLLKLHHTLHHSI